jgi:hypothetical protein
MMVIRSHEMEKMYLCYGLNALSRAHESNYFIDGHRGGAIISGVYLCQENEVEPGLSSTIAAILDERWTKTGLCAPFQDEGADRSLLQKILDSMQNSGSVLREAGHNVILSALALKAFRDVPKAISPARVEGICRLIESFSVTHVLPGEAVSLPDFENRAAFANFILKEFVQCTQRFSGRGQGWSGHLLTYSRAILDLVDLGYQETARRVRDGFTIYIQRIRSGPQEIDQQRPEHLPTDLYQLQTAYWEQREGDLNPGHKIKYPNGFYGLFGLADDEAIRQQSLDAAYRIF